MGSVHGSTVRVSIRHRSSLFRCSIALVFLADCYCNGSRRIRLKGQSPASAILSSTARNLGVHLRMKALRRFPIFARCRHGSCRDSPRTPAYPVAQSLSAASRESSRPATFAHRRPENQLYVRRAPGPGVIRPNVLIFNHNPQHATAKRNLRPHLYVRMRLDHGDATPNHAETPAFTGTSCAPAGLSTSRVAGHEYLQLGTGRIAAVRFWPGELEKVLQHALTAGVLPPPAAH